MTFGLETNFQKPGVKIHKWDPKSLKGVNMGFIKIHSTQVGLVLNMFAGSISAQYHVIFYDMLSTVANITAIDP